MKFCISLLVPFATTHSLSTAAIAFKCNNNNSLKKNNNSQSSKVTTDITSSKNNQTMLPVYIHSTFRNKVTGRQVLPHGLEWDLDGDSHLLFVGGGKDPSPMSLLQAYNRWCAAKDLPYKTIDDIESVTPQGPNHLRVEWKNKKDSSYQEQVVLGDNMEELLQADEAYTSGNTTAQVWIHGEFQGILSNHNKNDLQDILAKIPKETHNKLCYKRTPTQIHINRYYTSFLRYNQAWDHVWDCVVALEDPKILDSQTVIGTATLQDWIMGGQLTSRLWIQDQGSCIVFKRPLYHDDLSTSDRNYQITEEPRMTMVRQELTRLRYLAKLKHPYVIQLLEDRQTKKKQKQKMGEEEKGKVGTAVDDEETPPRKRKIASYLGF